MDKHQLQWEMWAISISSMRGWITILGFWLHVCPILTSCCSLNNGLTSITMRNMGHFNFKHERMTENRNVDYFNFKHERLNKNSLIIALFLLFCSLSNGWISIAIRNVDHLNFMHKRLKENKNVDSFNFKHERLNKNYLIIAWFLSYLDLFFHLLEMDAYHLQ